VLGALAVLLVTAPLVAQGQQSSSGTFRIGVLGAEGAVPLARFLDALRSDLRDAGYIEGRNLIIVVRHADGRYDRLPALVAEFVRLDVDVIVTSGSKAGIAAKEATSKVPIVVDNMGDAVQAGFVASYAKPGGNVTGISALNPEMTAKQLALLKEIMPRTTTVAALMNPAIPITTSRWPHCGGRRRTSKCASNPSVRAAAWKWSGRSRASPPPASMRWSCSRRRYLSRMSRRLPSLR
jgi:putative ABC transport system substrate-binding protein